MVDCNNKANILHYGSKKCRRITRSVMAPELLALVTGFDYAYGLKVTMQELLGREMELDVFVDSRTTFNCVAKNASTLEKMLQIDVAGLRESYARGEINCLGWIPGSENPADGLTRSVLLKKEQPLVRLMSTNNLSIRPEGWALRN